VLQTITVAGGGTPGITQNEPLPSLGAEPPKKKVDKGDIDSPMTDPQKWLIDIDSTAAAHSPVRDSG